MTPPHLDIGHATRLLHDAIAIKQAGRDDEAFSMALEAHGIINTVLSMPAAQRPPASIASHIECAEASVAFLKLFDKPEVQRLLDLLKQACGSRHAD